MTDALARLSATQSLTMTTREIAELVSTTHDSVLKTVRRLISEGIVSGNETPYIHPQNGQMYPEFKLTFRDTMVVASGYDAPLRARIIDRWQELEDKQAKPYGLPRTMAEALRLAADQCEQIEAQQLKIKHDAPKVELVDNFLATENGKTGSLVARELAKEFVIGRNRLYDFLVEHGIFNAQLQPKQEQVEAGRFYMQPSTYKTTDGVLSSASVRFTAKGVFHVRALLQKHNFTKRSAA